ncbi:hypothetical protein COL154_013993, partial [Colletotrichum chrysophilum]
FCLNTFQHFNGKRISQQTACSHFIQTTGTQEEQLIFIELANGTAVTTFNVVRQVAVILIGIGLLGIFMHDDFTVEYRMTVAVQYAFIDFFAGSVGHFVVDTGMGIDMLIISHK